MVKLKNIRQISLGTLVKIVYWDNFYGARISDLDADSFVKSGVDKLVTYGVVYGKNKEYITIASHHPYEITENENGISVVGVLWKCVESIEVLKVCSR